MKNFLGINDFIWFFGVVEDRNDPVQLGRLRVRCYGWHTDDKNQIPTDSLPWAVPIQDVTSAGVSGKGKSPTGIVEGSWVIGFFADGKKAQEPYIMGTIAGAPKFTADTSKGFYDPNGVYPKYVDESDVNKLARGTNTITIDADSTIGAPEASYKAEYPFNHVTETESGHIIEIDDTKGKERINVLHKSGTFVEIQPSGDVVIQQKNGFKTVTGNDKIHVTGNMDFFVDGDINFNTRGNFNVTTFKNVDIKSKRIDLNSNFGNIYSPELIDDPVTFETNIVKVKPDSVPPEHPDNPEQIEQSADPDKDYAPLAPATCGSPDNPQRNPYDIANQLLAEGGWKELHKQGGTNPKIKFLWDEIGYNGAQYADEVAWCAVFTGAVLKRSGNKYIKTAQSRKYAGYGKKVSLDDVKQGDIVVFFRNGLESGKGHVGFATGNKTDRTIEVLGGNQSNTLSVRSYQLSNPAKGFGLLTIRRAVSCDDGETEAPNATDTSIAESAGEGGAVT
tara:strand:+ start:291 stop:1802 length:1512 start_codon:yes stop_codon:yes gene_type:complete